MKFSIRHKIIFFFSLASLLVFSALGAYIGFAVRPRTMTQTRFAISQMVESKANEVSMWVKRMAVEYRTIAAIPAFSSMDVREITPLIDRFTELYKKNGNVLLYRKKRFLLDQFQRRGKSDGSHRLPTSLSE